MAADDDTLARLLAATRILGARSGYARAESLTACSSPADGAHLGPLNGDAATLAFLILGGARD